MTLNDFLYHSRVHSVSIWVDAEIKLHGRVVLGIFLPWVTVESFALLGHRYRGENDSILFSIAHTLVFLST